MTHTDPGHHGREVPHPAARTGEAAVEDPLRVREPSTEYEEDERPREPVRTVEGSTPKLRRAGQRYLPRNFEVAEDDGKELGETPNEYARRLRKSVCYGYLQDAVRANVGKVQKKPVTVEELPEDLEHLTTDCDGEGTSLTSFAGWLVRRGWIDGIDFFLVTIDTDEDGAAADDAEPHFAHVPASSLIGFKTETVNGQTYFSQVRILTSRKEEEGEFHDAEVEQVLVFDAGDPTLPEEPIPGEPAIPDSVYPTWRVFEVVESSDTQARTWSEVDRGVLEIPQWDGEDDADYAMRMAYFIPLVPYYVLRTGFGRGHPPMETLAHLEVCHWQKQSDLDNIEWAANVPRPYVTGVENPEDFAVVESGVQRTYALRDANAKVGFWEHSGASVRELKESVKRLELRMLVESAEPQRGEVTRQETATGRVIDADRAASPLHASVLSLEDSLTLGLLYAGWWKGLPLQLDDYDLKANRDLGSVMSNLEIARLLIELAKLPPQQRVVGAETILRQLVRRGVLPEDTNIDVEVEALGDILTSLPSPGGGGGPVAELAALDVTL